MALEQEPGCSTWPSSGRPFWRRPVRQAAAPVLALGPPGPPAPLLMPAPSEPRRTPGPPLAPRLLPAQSLLHQAPSALSPALRAQAPTPATSGVRSRKVRMHASQPPSPKAPGTTDWRSSQLSTTSGPPRMAVSQALPRNPMPARSAAMWRQPQWLRQQPSTPRAAWASMPHRPPWRGPKGLRRPMPHAGAPAVPCPARRDRSRRCAI
mmetsp:Transcript_52740/g.112849  ORF Transcript_52740/g.112849 Transcript_52740/m.112849 type:complete len:208 (-) Transcript_52740:583-1206(-)